MFYKLLERKDVLDFIGEIRTNKRYFLKKSHSFENLLFFMPNKIALYIFYDALYKYQILIDDIYLFDEYLSQLEKLYRRIDNFEDIRIGIHQLICRMLITKFSIDNTDDLNARKEIISYVYDKYIVNGYFIHGFASCYYDFLEKNSFVPEKYQNYYDSFYKIDSIFKKYIGKSIISKDFSSDKVFYTDDFVMGCYHSIYAPMFFYEFLSNELFGKKVIKDFYNYDMLISPLKKYMSNNLFLESDRKFILNLVKKQWDFLQENNDKITLLLVKRDKIFKNEVLLQDYLKDNHSLYEIVDRILSSKYSSVSSNLVLERSDFELVSINSYCDNSSVEENEEVPIKDDIAQDNGDVLNKNGNVSVLLLLGSLFISFGVIITIISILRG